MDWLKDQHILVTGASGGIGGALARRLAAAGAQVLAIGRNEARLRDLAATPETAGRVAWVAADLSRAEDIGHVFSWIDAHWTRLDAVIHNAAAAVSGKSAAELPAEEIHAAFAAGPAAALHLIREAARRMRSGGRIVLASSGAGHSGFAGMTAYCAAKFALEGVAQAAALDLWQQGITVNTVALPSVQTELSRPHFPAEAFATFPKPDDVLAPFLYLLSPAAERYSGRALFIHEHYLQGQPDLPPLRRYRALAEPLLPPSRREWREQGISEPMVKADLGEAPLPPSPRVAEAVARWMAGPHTEEYPDARTLDLRVKLAARHGLTPEHLLVGPGSSAILAWILDHLVDPASEVIAGEFCFRLWRQLVLLRGIKLVEYLNEAAHHDIFQIMARVTPQTRLIYLDSPSNPMGDVIKADHFKWFLSRLPRHVWVVVDHAYQDFVVDSQGADTTTADWLQDRRLLSVRTLSKSHALSGWRVGYVAAHPDTTAALAGSVGPFYVPTASQVAALAALDDPAHAAAIRDLFISERARIRQRLDAAGIPYWLGETSFIAVYWPQVSSIFDAALRAGIAIPRVSNNSMFIAAIRQPALNDRVLDFLETNYPADHRARPATAAR